MKRLNSQALLAAFVFVALVVAALIVALPASQPLMANPPGQKVCHTLPSASPFTSGVVILAPSDQALAEHQTHGDCLALGLAQPGDSCSCVCIPPDCNPV